MTIARRPMRILALMLGAEILLGGAGGGLLAAMPVAAAGQPHVKVVIVVGPVGRVTDYYRELANESADAARARTDEVVTVYSPDATWPVVRRALQGASIVVYLGHGNGWPSPYRDALYRTTQNGLGLNPVAGGDNSAHQYFGERYLARDVHLAPGAVVILGHLCYASGDAEPGMPDPTLDVARQRVDNYAAGWLAAGATAVVAEGHGRPAWYVKSLLKGRGTIEQMWRAAPTFHDHVIESDGARTPGTTVMLDPERQTRDYFRSLVTVPGARIADTLAGARTPPGAPDQSTTPDAPSPADRGATFGAPQLDGRTVVASQGTLTVPVDATTLGFLPDDVSIGTRWDPLAPAADAPLGEDPPTIELIGPEAPGAVVTVAPSTRADAGLTVPVTVPARPGLYRLVTTIHDGDGVAFGAETQDLLPALLVRVTDVLSAAYGAPSELQLGAGAPITIPVRVANTGSEPWSRGSSIEAIAPAGEANGGVTADTPAAADPPADSPVALWRLGEYSGLVADSIGDNDAGVVGVPTPATNPSLPDDDGAIFFPSTDDYLTVPDAPALDLGDGPFSIEFWFRRDTDMRDQVSLLDKGADGYSIVIVDDRLSLAKVGVANLVSESGTTPADSTWHHFVVTRTGPGAGNTRWYKDGVEGHTDISPETSLADTTAALEIGRGDMVPGGALDELAIYRSVLPAVQVAAHRGPGRADTSNPTVAVAPAPKHVVLPRRPVGPDSAPHLVARWVSLDDIEVAGRLDPTAVRADIHPGEEAVLDLELVSPGKPGTYLLMFDLQTEDGVSLASIGVPPAITRVVVGPASPGQDLQRPAPGGL